MIEVCFIKREIVVGFIFVEIKVFIGVICKVRSIYIDVRIIEIYVRVLCFCIVIIKVGLIDSDMVSCIKIESGFIVSRKWVVGCDMVRIKINCLSVISVCDIFYITFINICAFKVDISFYIKCVIIEFLCEISFIRVISGKGV